MCALVLFIVAGKDTDKAWQIYYGNNERSRWQETSCKCVNGILQYVQCECTHTHTQLFYGSVDYVRDNPGEPVPEETFTHSHLSWSSIIPYLLHPSTTIHTASSLFNPHTWLSFSTISLEVFFGLPLGLAPSTSYSIHFFTHSLSSFRNTCPYHCNQFRCSTKTKSSNPSLSQSFTWNSVCPLIDNIWAMMFVWR